MISSTQILKILRPVNTEIIINTHSYRKRLIILQLEKLCPENLYLFIFTLLL